MICEYFRLTGANDSVENFADLFTVVLRNDDIQEFDSKWHENLLSMTQIPSDDILESLYNLRIRESEKLKTVLELYNMEIHQKKAGPDQVDEQPSRRSKRDGEKSAVVMLKITRQLGLRMSRYGAAGVFIDFTEELRHTETNPMCSIH